MKAKAYTATGEARSTDVELPEPLFDGTVHEAALHQVVTAIQAHGRQGTASTKDRSTISGGSQKPWRQKGTGRARHGSIRSPIWRGGAVTFGPKPRDFGGRVPKKLRRLAIQSALNARAREGNLVVLEPLQMEEPSTATMASLLEALERDGRKTILLTDGLKKVVHLSMRNIPDVEVKPWGRASAYDLIRAQLVIVEEDAWKAGSGGAGNAADAAGDDADAGEDGA